jgi:Zn-dependent protease/predicted transcriptional regulator
MEPSLQIIKLLGIPVKLHWTCLLAIPFGMYLLEKPGFGLEGLIFFSILFGLISICVILHEYGHAMAAKYYDIKTDDIILSPLFGVARIQKLPDTPFGEFMVAVAGPAVNILLGLIFLIYLQIANPDFLSAFGYELYHSFLSGGKRVVSLPEGFSKFNISIAILIFVNLGLVVFNLIPAFPMDGGRMFRAFLHSFMDKLAATKLATFVGKVIALLICVISIFYQQYAMALVGVFIYYMANSEFKMVQGETFRNKFIIKEMMKKSFTTLNKFTTKKEVSELFLNGYENNFLIYDTENNLIGILIKNKIIKWLSDKSFSLENDLNDFTIFDFPKINEDLRIDEVLEIMRASNITFLPIEKDGEIIGVIDRQSIYEFIDVQQKIIS